ncbi:MAG: hypothetical protein R3A46_03850 [Thermomicrobiales bacterium]
MMHPDLSQMLVEDRQIERNEENRQATFQRFAWADLKAALTRPATAIRTLLLSRAPSGRTEGSTSLQMRITASSRQ